MAEKEERRGMKQENWRKNKILGVIKDEKEREKEK